jgi:GTP-binding protein
LGAYGGGLEEKAELIALNKIDALDKDARAAAAKAIRKASGVRPFMISAVSGEGVRDLLRAAHGKVRERDTPSEAEETADGGAAEPWRP